MSHLVENPEALFSYVSVHEMKTNLTYMTQQECFDGVWVGQVVPEFAGFRHELVV